MNVVKARVDSRFKSPKPAKNTTTYSGWRWGRNTEEQGNFWAFDRCAEPWHGIKDGIISRGGGVLHLPMSRHLQSRILFGGRGVVKIKEPGAEPGGLRQGIAFTANERHLEQRTGSRCKDLGGGGGINRAPGIGNWPLVIIKRQRRLGWLTIVAEQE